MAAKFSLVLGGAASGKSAFAEDLVQRSGRPKTYIATARIWDDEMRAKVDRHIEMRGAGWATVEAPLDLGPALAGLAQNDVALVDCATMWLTNHMMEDTDLTKAEATLFRAIEACPAEIVMVSNEVGHGIVPENALSRRFVQAQGMLNQRLAARADLVVNVIAGLPHVLKGVL